MSILRKAYSSAQEVLDRSILKRGLPASTHVACHPDPNNPQAFTVEMAGIHPDTGVTQFDCKFSFNFAAGNKSSAIKNFSIHDARERGQGLGAMVVANLLDTTKAATDLERIMLTAELERGAFVWAKMGWVPTPTSFTKLQRKCLPKLDVLQQIIPPENRLSPTVYGIFRDLLDATSTHDPKYIWSIVDSAASYDTEALRHLQQISNIPNDQQRLNAIQSAAKRNNITLNESDAIEADKILRFLKNMDLNGLDRDGKIPVAMVLFAWEQWKGELNLADVDQMRRIESRLQKVREIHRSADLNEVEQGQQTTPRMAYE